jgi:hypothetical protein
MTTSLDIEALVDQRSAGQTAQLIGMSNNSHGIRDMAVDCCKQADARFQHRHLTCSSGSDPVWDGCTQAFRSNRWFDRN